MEILNGIKNFLQFINDNWMLIAAIITLGFSIYKKVKDYFSKSIDEQVAIAKQQISESMLKLVTKAECDYNTWVSAGSVKRSQVIEEIFMKYPILSKVTNQKELIQWIDNTINDALKTMRDVCAINAKQVYGTDNTNESNNSNIDIVNV